MGKLILEYHWYEEPENVFITIRKSFQKELIRKCLEKERKLHGSIKTLSNKLNIHLRTIFRWKSYETKGFYIKNLKEICEFLNIVYEDLERQKVITSIGGTHKTEHEKIILKPKLPFHLDNGEMAELIGYAFSDGCLSSRQKNFIYVSNDKNQINRIAFLISKLFGKVIPRIEREEKNYQVVVFPPTVGRVLNRFGVPVGHKIGQQIEIPNWIKMSFPRNYLRAVFTDEGSFKLRAIKTQRHKNWSVLMHITHGRSRDITADLKHNQIKEIYNIATKGKYLQFNKLSKSFKDFVANMNPPQLLKEEVNLLHNLDIEIGKIRPMRLHISKEGKISCYWRFQISQNSIINFYKKLGFCKETEKQNKFVQEVKKFKRFKNLKLTDLDLQKYRLPTH